MQFLSVTATVSNQEQLGIYMWSFSMKKIDLWKLKPEKNQLTKLTFCFVLEKLSSHYIFTFQIKKLFYLSTASWEYLANYCRIKTVNTEMTYLEDLKVFWVISGINISRCSRLLLYPCGTIEALKNCQTHTLCSDID